MQMPLFKKKMHSYDTLFNPDSIAVVGASNDISKIGGFIFSELLKSNKKVIPVNLKWKSIQGHKAYRSISDLSFVPDLVIVAIPSNLVIDVVIECSEKKIKNIVIISAGFKEIGVEGIEKENRLKKIIKEHNLNVVGPNCLGFLNPEQKINASFAKELPKEGNVALLSQSGAIIDAIIDWSFKTNIGFSKIVSLGNMAGINEVNLIKYLKDDPKTKAIVLYAENIDNGLEFAKLSKELEKPIILLYPGKSKNAQKAIGSHTGSLAHDSKLSDVLFSDNGIILADNLNDLFESLKIITYTKIPNNENVIIVTNAGGLGVLATDALENTDFNLRSLNEWETKKLSFLPVEASLKNPIDILGDATSERYLNTLSELTKFENLGTVLVLLTPQVMTDSLKIAKDISTFNRSSDKTIVCSFVGGKQIKNALFELEKHNVPIFETPEIALKILNKFYIRNKKRTTKSKSENEIVFNKLEIDKIKLDLEKYNGLLPHDISSSLLKSIGIKVPNKIVIKSYQELESIDLNKNQIYIAKIDGILHKKDIGAIEKNITTDNVKEKLLELIKRTNFDFNSMSITLEQEVKGHELFIGMKKDKSLGNFILFGFGGTYVNLLNKIDISSCPIDKSKAIKMISNTSINKILDGFRGDKKIDPNILIELMVKFSHILEIFPQIKEIDVNPIILNSEGANLVDVKILV